LYSTSHGTFTCDWGMLSPEQPEGQPNLKTEFNQLFNLRPFEIQFVLNSLVCCSEDIDQ
jgi:hypothetical protein